MEFISLLLSLIGLRLDDADRRSTRRNEAARVCSEISSEVAQAIDYLDQESARLRRRCAAISPGDEQSIAALTQAFSPMRKQAEELFEQVRSTSLQIEQRRTRLDWDILLRQLYGWKATTSRLLPWLSGAVKQFDETLDRANVEGR